VRRLTSIATGLALAAGSLALASPASAAVATKVSIKVDHAPAYVGDEVTANGKLTRSNGAVLRGKNLLLTYGGGKKIVTTNRDGLWIAEIAPKSGAIQIEFLGDGSYGESTAATQTYTLQYRTAISGFRIKPNPIVKNTITKISGHVDTLVGSKRSPLGNAGVDLFWSPDGKTWNWSAAAAANGSGNFYFNPTVGEDSLWKVVVKANLTADGNLSTEAAGRVDTRFKTGLSFWADPKNIRYGRKLTVHGKLVHYDGAWVPFGGRVAVYFRAKGAKNYRFKGWASVGSNGKYSKRFKATRDGYWRAIYGGNGENFRIISTRRYVNVK
jgi:hypothetical protein